MLGGEKGRGGKERGKERKKDFVKSCGQLLPTRSPLSCLPHANSVLLLMLGIPPTEAWGDGCLGSFEVTKRKIGRKKNQVGQEGAFL